MIAFSQFAKVCNRYCFAYFGYHNEYLIQLRHIRPLIEQQFPGLEVFIACRDDISILQGQPRVVNRTQLEQMASANEFAHIKTLADDCNRHPVQRVVEESDISLAGLSFPRINADSKKCVILTQATLPVRPIDEMLPTVQQLVRSSGFTPEINGSINDAGLVVGPECEKLYEAGTKGIRTSLIPSGLGTKLYQMFFTNGDVLLEKLVEEKLGKGYIPGKRH